MTVFVTGAQGFLGRAVALGLHRAGHAVVSVARRAEAVSPEIPHVALDLESGSYDALAEGAKEGGAMVHFAARLPVAPVTDAEAAASNRLMDDRVMEFCGAHGLALVYASGMFYRRSPEVLTEAAELDPRTLYHREKASSEERGLAAGVTFSALRLSAPYGAGQQVRTVLKIFLERARRSEAIQYFGAGTREQDFTHVRDVVAAARACLERPATGVFNIASGVPVTMRELAELVVAATPGSASEIRAAGAPDPQDGYPARYSIARAADILGWRPRVTLADGVREWASALARES